MARRFIDGMAVNVPDEDAPMVGVDIDDVVYEDQEASGVVECHSTEEYEDAATAYNSAQKLLTLLQCEGFGELGRLLNENAEYHAAAERRYTANDAAKIDGLRGNRVAADYTFKFVTNLIENAKQTPRPVLVK